MGTETTADVALTDSCADRDQLITEVVDVLQELIDSVGSVVDLSVNTDRIDQVDRELTGPVERLAEGQRRLADAVAELQVMVGDLDAMPNGRVGPHLAASGE